MWRTRSGEHASGDRGSAAIGQARRSCAGGAARRCAGQCRRPGPRRAPLNVSRPAAARPAPLARTGPGLYRHRPVDRHAPLRAPRPAPRQPRRAHRRTALQGHRQGPQGAVHPDRSAPSRRCSTINCSPSESDSPLRGPGPSTPLFVDGHNRQLRPRGAQYLVRQCYRFAGVGGRVPHGALVHALCHSLASRLAEDGATASGIQHLRHESLATSQGYIDATARAQRDAARANRTYRALERIPAKVNRRWSVGGPPGPQRCRRGARTRSAVRQTPDRIRPFRLPTLWFGPPGVNV
jgi:hypothetical protein